MVSRGGWGGQVGLRVTEGRYAALQPARVARPLPQQPAQAVAHRGRGTPRTRSRAMKIAWACGGVVTPAWWAP